jgi:hypothetical protein
MKTTEITASIPFRRIRSIVRNETYFAGKKMVRGTLAIIKYYCEISNIENPTRETYKNFLETEMNRDGSLIHSSIKFNESYSTATLNYIAYIFSDEWRAKKEDVYLAKGKICELCGSNEYITVHHKTYIRMTCEDLDDLQVLCVDCHQDIHKKIKAKYS